MKRVSAASSAVVAATLVSTMALMGATGTLASEPLRLSQVQMDAVTAGSAVKSNMKTRANAIGKNASTNAGAVTDVNGKSTSGAGIATASATDGSVKTKVTGSSEVPSGKVQGTTSGQASGNATSNSKLQTMAKEAGAVTVVHGVAKSHATGTDAKVTASVVSTLSGGKTIVKKTINKTVNNVAMSITVGVSKNK